MKVVVTGGAGFIGSAVVRHILSTTDWKVVNLDKLTYAGNLDSLISVARHPRHIFAQLDICDGHAVANLLRSEQPDAIMHLAAESHVDRSIDGPSAFIETNVVGTFRLLDVTKDYWRTLEAARQTNFRFHHVSTDEVYGSLGPYGQFREDSPYRPNSPYSASKAASDHLARAWHHTYGLPVITSNCSNNYGPFQFPEKLIPLCIIRAVEGKSIPIYGRGENIRDWLYVDDHARALTLVISRGVPGEAYNIGGGAERRNIDIVNSLCGLLDRLHPRADGRPYSQQITFVADRPGHDMRYSIDAGKITTSLGFVPTESLETGLEKTVIWYLKNTDWVNRILSGAYRGERLGMGDTV